MEKEKLLSSFVLSAIEECYNKDSSSKPALELLSTVLGNGGKVYHKPNSSALIVETNGKFYSIDFDSERDN